MKPVVSALSVLVCILLVAACGDDGYVYPSVVTEWVTMQTDADGTVSTLTQDDGTVLTVVQRDGLDGLIPDTTYRTVSMYLPSEEDEGTVTLYTCSLVLAPIPVTRDYYKDSLYIDTPLEDTIYTDPVDIQSMRRSGDYLDMVLLAQVKNGTHIYNLIHEGIDDNCAGGRTLHLRLYHFQNYDALAFTKKVYVSVPLWAYADSLSLGDSIEFALNTFEEGETSRWFTY